MNTRKVDYPTLEAAANGRANWPLVVEAAYVLAEVERLREHETWLKLGHEAADGFLDGPSQTHIVDKVCIIGHERDELRTLVGELRAILPIERPEQGGDPGWLADLKRRAAEAAA